MGFTTATELWMSLGSHAWQPLPESKAIAPPPNFTLESPSSSYNGAMARFVIFDGRPSEAGDHLREKRLTSWIQEVDPEGSITVVQDIDSLIEVLEDGLDGKLVLVHHSEWEVGSGPHRTLPDRQHYFHYSGAGFQKVPPAYEASPASVFGHESIDRTDEALSTSLKAWVKQQLGDAHALDAYRSPSQPLVGDFPRWLKQLHHNLGLGPMNPDDLRSWAARTRLPCGSLPTRATVDAMAADPHQHSSDLDGELSKLRHDLKHLLFQLEDPSTFDTRWNDELKDRISNYRQLCSGLSAAMEAVHSWMDGERDPRDGKKSLLALRDALHPPVLPMPPSDPPRPDARNPAVVMISPSIRSQQLWARAVSQVEGTWGENFNWGPTSGFPASMTALGSVLRSRSPLELFHTQLVVDVGSALREALQAGQRHEDLGPLSHWTHDASSQLGLVVRLALTFPQMGLLVLHDLDAEALRDCLRHELFFSVPDSVPHQEELLERLIEQHFFHHDHLTQAVQRSLTFLRGWRSLFDPTGLRTLCKLRLIANIFASGNDRGRPNLEQTLEQRTILAKRLENVALAVDEDQSSALFHAYGCYRFGYRSSTVTDFRFFDDPDTWKAPGAHRIVLRDTDLRFPDIHGREPPRQGQDQRSVRARLEDVTSDLWTLGPAPEFSPKLAQGWWVRTIAAGEPGLKEKLWPDITEEERVLGQRGNDLVGIPKPLSSLYDLGLVLPGDPRPLAAGIVPPRRLEGNSGHFAPYINLPLASELLVQAKRLSGEHELHWLIGAILALEADEVLLGMSEYTGLEAIRWLHRCEVRAEIRSVGFSGSLHIHSRKQELESLVNHRYSKDELSRDHFLSRLWDDLRSLYKSTEQFHAAEEANIESFCKHKHFPRTHWAHIPEEILRRGVILCASSVFAWCGVFLFATMALWALYSLGGVEGAWDVPLLFQVLASSLIGEPAFGIQEVNPQAPFLKAVILAHYGSSYVLFGFFLSMVYRRITRS